MKIKRECMDCGKEFEAEVDDKTKRVLVGVYWGKMDPHEMASPWSWHSKFLLEEEKIDKTLYQRIMTRLFWWYSIPEEECTVPNWKKPYYLLRQKIDYWRHPEKMVEMWSCPDCL